jgi:hypothetical protein
MSEKGLREEFIVARLYAKHQKELGVHQYESEFRRWVDMVTSIFFSVSDVPEVNIEAATRMLIAVDLLNIDRCANLPENHEESKVFDEILMDFDFSSEEALKARQAVVGFSRVLTKNWDRKIQHYLRVWGERILADMVVSFHIDSLSETEVKEAFTRWLQIASNMPILLSQEAMNKFAESHGTTIEALIAAADRLDLNIAFLDEVIHSEMMEKEE